MAHLNLILRSASNRSPAKQWSQAGVLKEGYDAGNPPVHLTEGADDRLVRQYPGTCFRFYLLLFWPLTWFKHTCFCENWLFVTRNLILLQRPFHETKKKDWMNNLIYDCSRTDWQQDTEVIHFWSRTLNGNLNSCCSCHIVWWSQYAPLRLYKPYKWVGRLVCCDIPDHEVVTQIPLRF